MSDANQFDWDISTDETDDDFNTGDTIHEDATPDQSEDTDTTSEQVDTPDISDKITKAVDAALAARRKQLLDNAKDDKVRKAVPILTSDRKKIKRRNIDTDVAVSDLASDAVIALLAEGTEVGVATDRAAKNRKDRITLTAPSWWWGLVSLTADAYGGQQADVIATAINKHLP